jgi:hypothetical protein
MEREKGGWFVWAKMEMGDRGGGTAKGGSSAAKGCWFWGAEREANSWVRWRLVQEMGEEWC